MTDAAFSPRRFRRGAIESLVLQGASVGILFVMQVVLGRLLGAKGFGIFSYALSAGSVTALIVTLGLPNGAMRFVAEYSDGRHWALLKGVLIRSAQIVLLSSILGAAILFALGLSVPEDQADLKMGLTMGALFVPLVALGQWRSRVVRGFARVRESLIPEEVLLPAIAVVGVLVFQARSPGSAVMWYGAASLCALALGSVWLVRALPKEVSGVSPSYSTRLWMSVSIPMILGSALQLSLNRSDVLLLGVLADLEVTGVYVAAARIALLCAFVLRSVDVVVAPLVAAGFHGGRSSDVRLVFRRGMKWSGLGALPLVAASLMLAEPLLGLFGPEFRAGGWILRILVAGQFVNALTGPVGFTLLMTGHEWVYARTLIVATAISVAGNVLVIPWYGAVGAAVVTATVTAGMNLWLLVEVRHRVLRIGVEVGR